MKNALGLPGKKDLVCVCGGGVDPPESLLGSGLWLQECKSVQYTQPPIFASLLLPAGPKCLPAIQLGEIKCCVEDLFKK